MKNYKNQKGVGLMEVLVALLILAIGVLGFIALQYRAVEASTEGENRIQAINLARDVAEKIRSNRTAVNTYGTSLAVTNRTDLPTPNCFNVFCTPNQKADFDSAVVQLSASRMGMRVNMMTCPGISNNRSCIYVAWGDTAPTADGDDVDCTSNTGNYVPNSTCVVMEVY